VITSWPYEGVAAPLPDISPAWSPVARFGAYQRNPSGARQAKDLMDASLDSELQQSWRDERGYGETSLQASGPCDPLEGCSIF
jgi:hypothetical protein